MKSTFIPLKAVIIVLTLLCSFQNASGCARQPTTTPPGAVEINSNTMSTPKPTPGPQPTAGSSANGSEEGDAMITINITVGKSIFSAKLYNNSTAKAFLAQLPMTLNMSELNGNEKYYYLPDALPTDSEKVGTIHTGDLMLYGSDCLVLFYKSFSTTYSYTKLGYTENVSGLAAALGNGSVQVILSKQVIDDD